MKDLTAKEKKAVEGIIAGKTKRQAIKDAYNCTSVGSADVIGQKVFKKDKVIRELQGWREIERKQLLPKAIKVIDAILNTPAKGLPTWDVLRKTAFDIKNSQLNSEESKITSKIKYIRQFIKDDKVRDMIGEAIEVTREERKEE